MVRFRTINITTNTQCSPFSETFCAMPVVEFSKLTYQYYETQLKDFAPRQAQSKLFRSAAANFDSDGWRIMSSKKGRRIGVRQMYLTFEEIVHSAFGISLLAGSTEDS